MRGGWGRWGHPCRAARVARLVCGWMWGCVVRGGWGHRARPCCASRVARLGCGVDVGVRGAWGVGALVAARRACCSKRARGTLGQAAVAAQACAGHVDVRALRPMLLTAGVTGADQGGCWRPAAHTPPFKHPPCLLNAMEPAFHPPFSRAHACTHTHTLTHTHSHTHTHTHKYIHTQAPTNSSACHLLTLLFPTHRPRPSCPCPCPPAHATPWHPISSPPPHLALPPPATRSWWATWRLCSSPPTRPSPHAAAR